MRIQGLLNICRQNILSAERDQISRMVEKIKSCSLKGHTYMYEDEELNEKTMQFLRSQNFTIEKENDLVKVAWNYPTNSYGSMYKEAINNVRVHRKSRLVNEIKYQTYRGRRNFLYSGPIDEDVKQDLTHEGFQLEEQDYDVLISIPITKEKD